MSTHQWPTPEQRASDSSWTARIPRPDAGDTHPAHLADRQQQWDESDAKRQRTAAKAAEIQAAREAAVEANRERDEAARQARDQRQVDALTARLKRSYLAQPGATEADFARALPELLEAERRTGAAELERAARRSQRALYTSF